MTKANTIGLDEKVFNELSDIQMEYVIADNNPKISKSETISRLIAEHNKVK